MPGVFLLIYGIKGKSRQEGFRDYLDVTSWKIGADIPVDIGSSKGSSTTGQSNLTDLTCQIISDTSMVRQFQSCLSGRHFTDAHLVVTKDVSKRAGKTETVEFLYLDMENVIISSCGLGGYSGGSRAKVGGETVQNPRNLVPYHRLRTMCHSGNEPFLAISLKFARYKMYYVLYDEKGNKVGQDVAGYDIPRHADFA
jgi:type VI protein secretion system component Hcp